MKPTKYKTINLRHEAYNQLVILAKQLATDYASVNLGNLVSQLIHEKAQNLTLKK